MGIGPQHLAMPGWVEAMKPFPVVPILGASACPLLTPLVPLLLGNVIRKLVTGPTDCRIE